MEHNILGTEIQNKGVCQVRFEDPDELKPIVQELKQELELFYNKEEIETKPELLCNQSHDGTEMYRDHYKEIQVKEEFLLKVEISDEMSPLMGELNQEPLKPLHTEGQSGPKYESLTNLSQEGTVPDEDKYILGIRTQFKVEDPGEKPQKLKQEQAEPLDTDSKEIDLMDPRPKCFLCNRMFTRREHLLRHNAAVHLKVRYQCMLCTKEYSRRDQLNRHMVAAHRGVKVPAQQVAPPPPSGSSPPSAAAPSHEFPTRATRRQHHRKGLVMEDDNDTLGIKSEINLEVPGEKSSLLPEPSEPLDETEEESETGRESPCNLSQEDTEMDDDNDILRIKPQVNVEVPSEKSSPLPESSEPLDKTEEESETGRKSPGNLSQEDKELQRVPTPVTDVSHMDDITPDDVDTPTPSKRQRPQKKPETPAIPPPRSKKFKRNEIHTVENIVEKLHQISQTVKPVEKRGSAITPASDELFHFGEYVTAQLRQLDPINSLKAQEAIQNILITERIKSLEQNRISTVTSNETGSVSSDAEGIHQPEGDILYAALEKSFIFQSDDHSLQGNDSDNLVVIGHDIEMNSTSNDNYEFV